MYLTAVSVLLHVSLPDETKRRRRKERGTSQKKEVGGQIAQYNKTIAVKTTNLILEIKYIHEFHVEITLMFEH